MRRLDLLFGRLSFFHLADVTELDPKTEEAIKTLAKEVREKGIEVEDSAQAKYKKNPTYWYVIRF